MKDEKEDLCIHWMTLMKLEDTGYWKRKHWRTRCGELALDEAVGLW